MVSIKFKHIVLFLMLPGICASCHKYVPRETKITAVAPAAFPTTAPAQDYVLRIGDIIDVKFFYQQELNETQAIRPDGKISLELIEEIEAAGLKPSELRQLLIEKYRPLLNKPAVAVIVREPARERVFVGGEVVIPGVVPLSGEMTVLQALMQAGGMKSTAHTENIVILRNQGTETPVYITLDLKNDLELSGKRHDIALHPMDIVFVPKSPIAKANEFVEQYIDKLIPMQRSVGVYYNLNPTRQ